MKNSAAVPLVSSEPGKSTILSPSAGRHDVFLTPKEAAGYLRVSKSYLDKLRVYGGGPRFLRFGKRKILYRKPDLAMVTKNAVVIMFDGMAEGWFTGKKLSDYIHGKTCDYVNARRIINGTDKASTLAGYATKFEAALAGGK